MEEEKNDSFEIFEKYFKSIKEVCLPATIRNPAGNYEVNPTVELIIGFILKTVLSMDDNLHKDNFLLLWMKFNSVLHPYFLHTGVHHLYKAQWIKDEHRTQKILGKDVNKLKTLPEGFFFFYNKEFNTFLEKMEKLRKEWDQDLLDKINIQKKELFDTGSTMGSGEYAGYIEF